MTDEERQRQQAEYDEQWQKDRLAGEHSHAGRMAAEFRHYASIVKDVHTAVGGVEDLDTIMAARVFARPPRWSNEAYDARCGPVAKREMVPWLVDQILNFPTEIFGMPAISLRFDKDGTLTWETVHGNDASD